MSLKAKFPTSVVFSSYPRGSRSDGERYSKNSPVDPTIVLLLLLLLLPPFVGYLVPFLLLLSFGLLSATGGRARSLFLILSIESIVLSLSDSHESTANKHWRGRGRE